MNALHRRCSARANDPLGLTRVGKPTVLNPALLLHPEGQEVGRRRGAAVGCTPTTDTPNHRQVSDERDTHSTGDPTSCQKSLNTVERVAVDSRI